MKPLKATLLLVALMLDPAGAAQAGEAGDPREWLERMSAAMSQ